MREMMMTIPDEECLRAIQQQFYEAATCLVQSTGLLLTDPDPADQWEDIIKHIAIAIDDFSWNNRESQKVVILLQELNDLQV